MPGTSNHINQSLPNSSKLYHSQKLTPITSICINHIAKQFSHSSHQLIICPTQSAIIFNNFAISFSELAILAISFIQTAISFNQMAISFIQIAISFIRLAISSVQLAISLSQFGLFVHPNWPFRSLNLANSSTTFVKRGRISPIILGLMSTAYRLAIAFAHYQSYIRLNGCFARPYLATSFIFNIDSIPITNKIFSCLDVANDQMIQCVFYRY